MGEIVSLRKARKRAKREADEKQAAANRLTHGRSKAQRMLDAARAEQSSRHIEGHKIDTGEAK